MQESPRETPEVTQNEYGKELPLSENRYGRADFCFVFTVRVIVGVSNSAEARHCQPETVLKL